MTTLPSTPFELLAGIIESVLRRVEAPIEAAERALSAGLESAVSAAAALPAAIMIAAVGLLVWGGRRLVRAVVVVVALHLVVLAQLWPNVLATVLLGLVAGAIGATSAFGFVRAVRPVRRRVRWVSHLGAGITVSLLVVVVVTITALRLTALQPAWNLSAIVLAFGLVVFGRSFEVGGTWPQLGRGALEQGLAAALLIGTVSGAGLGGLAVRAATTGDIALALQVLLAIAGVVVALVAATARDKQPAAGAVDGEPWVPPLDDPDLRGDRQ